MTARPFDWTVKYSAAELWGNRCRHTGSDADLRGALLDAGRRWPFWAIALYSTALFVAGHRLMRGVFSVGNRSPMLYATLFVMGLAWACMRRATGSQRIPILSHGLVDVGNLSVFVFPNLYVPAGM